VYDLCQTRLRWLRLAQAIALGGCGIGLVALAEASGASVVHQWLASMHDGAVPIGDVPRVSSTLSHPNEAAMLLELGLPLLVAWAWTASPQRRMLLGLAAVSTLLAIVLTFSRAGIASALASLATLAGFCLIHRERQRLVPLGVAAMVVPLALTWASFADPGLDRRLAAGLDLSSQTQPARLEFWSVAVDMLRDHPLLGVGPDNFRWQFAAYSGLPTNHLGVHAHNQYLETLADTGILGLVTFCWFLAALVRGAASRVRYAAPDWPWRAALLASLTAWLLHALLDDFERFWPTSIAFWLIAGLSLRSPAPEVRIEAPVEEAYVR